MGILIVFIYHFHRVKCVRIRSFSGPYIFLHSDWIRENTGQKNLEYWHFSCSVFLLFDKMFIVREYWKQISKKFWVAKKRHLKSLSTSCLISFALIQEFDYTFINQYIMSNSIPCMIFKYIFSANLKWIIIRGSPLNIRIIFFCGIVFIFCVCSSCILISYKNQSGW